MTFRHTQHASPAARATPPARSSRSSGLDHFAVSVYHGLRRGVQRLRLQRFIDFRLHQLIAVPPWRLRLPERAGRGLAVRPLTPSDLPELTRLRAARGLDYAARWQAGHEVLGAFLDGRLAAFVWLAHGPRELVSSFGCRWQIAQPMCWLYDLFSDPDILGTMPRLYGHLRQHLAQPGVGCQLLIGQVEFDNLRSRDAHARLGYQTLGAVWTWQLGPWRCHLSHARLAGQRRWRWHARDRAIPLHLLARFAPEPPPAARPSSLSPALRLQCSCGREVALAGESYDCACGRHLGHHNSGVALVGPAIPYWGEIPQPDMQAVIAQAEAVGWREAVASLVPLHLQAYVSGPHRADFADLLPLRPGARVLDVGAGWGAIAAALARQFEVVALEGVDERVRFISLRAQQDGLANLLAVRGDVNSVPWALGQFDAIVANGVLEWAALLKTEDPPRAVQLQFLHQLRGLLRPGGVIYVGIENRFGWSELRGEPDHSGLPYTSLLPRPVARWVCARSRSYRAHFNVGYRTYTYSFAGYRRLFAEVGLHIDSAWISPAGYNEPTKMVPLSNSAIRFTQRAGSPALPHRFHFAGWLRRQLRRAAARAWVWRLLGSDFIFLLRPQPGLEPAASVSVPATASATPQEMANA